jgi:hypothetical protein
MHVFGSTSLIDELSQFGSPSVYAEVKRYKQISYSAKAKTFIPCLWITFLSG